MSRIIYTHAVKDSFPIMVGYFTVSFVFGISCVNYGLPLWVAPLMSLFVYAGAAQFSFLALFTAGASITTIVLTTFLINLRHMLMSIYMSNKFNDDKLNRKFRWIYGHGLTDESFAFHSVLDEKNKIHYKYYISFNLACHFAWVVGAFLGSFTITYTKDFIVFNLEFALTAMMLYVLVVLINTNLKLFISILSIFVMILLNLIYESYLNVFIATFIGCGVGIWMKKKF